MNWGVVCLGWCGLGDCGLRCCEVGMLWAGILLVEMLRIRDAVSWEIVNLGDCVLGGYEFGRL